MPIDDEFFTPEEVDEQIDLLARRQGQLSESDVPAAHTISHLQQYYAKNIQTYAAPLERAWTRIVEEHQLTKQISQRKGRLISMQGYQGEQQEPQTLNSRPTSPGRHPLFQRLSVLAAVLFIGLLVGSTILVLNSARQRTSGTPKTKQVAETGSGGTPQPKPPHPITGGKCSIDTTKPHPQESKVSVPGLYTFAFNEQSDNLLYRYDPQAKKVVWSKKLCNAFEPAGTIEQKGILYLAGVDVTHESSSGMVSYLYALNETDGSAIWGIQFPTSVTPYKKDSPNYGSSPLDLGSLETPTIANGIIYVVQRTGVVYAYNATTGGQLWSFDSGRNAWATTSQGNGSLLDPSSVQVVNGIAYFSIVDRVYALNAQSGKELWAHNFHNALDINQSPAIANGTLYLTAFVPGYGSVMHPDTYIYAFDAQTGAQKWVTAKMRGYLNGPVAYSGNVYVSSYDGVWYTLNLANGAIEAQKTLSGGGYGDPVLINGVLYDLTESDTNNTLAVLNADGSVKWSVRVAGQYPVLDDVQGGIIYLSGRGSGVYAYRATDGKLLWHYEGYLPQPQGQLSVTIVP